MKLHSLMRMIGLASVLALPLSSLAQAPNAEAEKIYRLSLAATCANCHGTMGISVPRVDIPKIHSLSAEMIYDQMMGFKSGKRSGTIMPQLSKGYTDEEFVQLADYFSSVK